MFVMPQTDLFWDRFCKAIGKPEWEHDERFNAHMKRVEQNMYLIPEMDKIAATKTADEWDQVAKDFDIVLGRVQIEGLWVYISKYRARPGHHDGAGAGDE